LNGTVDRELYIKKSVALGRRTVGEVKQWISIIHGQ